MILLIFLPKTAALFFFFVLLLFLFATNARACTMCALLYITSFCTTTRKTSVAMILTRHPMQAPTTTSSGPTFKKVVGLRRRRLAHAPQVQVLIRQLTRPNIS